MMGNVNGLSLDLVIHPGETIKEVLEDRKMSQEELAIRTGFSPKHISEVISGKKNISSKFANKLEYALGISMELWINLQGLYDKEVIEIENLNDVSDKETQIIEELSVFSNYCVKENIISGSSSKKISVLNMRRFLNVNNLEVISKLPFLQAAFRGSKKVKVNNYVLYAWQKLCQYYTADVNLEDSFNAQKLSSKYEDIKKTMFLPTDEMINKLKEIFAECGIVFEVVKHFAGAPVQGFIQKKDDKIILCMTIRKSFSDIFWFTLFHEIGHLVNADFSDTLIDYTFENGDIELKADSFARNILINEEDYANFISSGKFSYNNIKRFALSQNVLPGIVIGRMQNDMKDYSFMANYKEKYKWS